jgi:hypothetical protein
LRLLKVPVGAGYEQVISTLGRRPGGERGMTERDRAPRQFIFGDGAGGVERIRIDFSGSHMDHLRDTLDTTPDAMRNKQDIPALPAMPSDLMPEPSQARGGRHAEPDFDDEFAAELEVGLADEYPDDLVPTPGGDGPDPDGSFHGAGRGDPA